MILMVGQYLFNRSIDSDEIKIMLNIIDRSFLGLLQPLDHAQGGWVRSLSIIPMEQ